MRREPERPDLSVIRPGPRARTTRLAVPLLAVALVTASSCTPGRGQGQPTPAATAATPSAPGTGAAPRRPAPAVTDTGTLDVGGRRRDYVLHVPALLADPVPLVFVLHGGGGTAAGMEDLTGHDRVADQAGVLVAYPQGTDDNWADGRGADEPDRNQVDDVAFFDALITKLHDEYRVDPGWVFATGLSNGAFMSNRLGCDLADRIAAIAPVAGTLGVDVTCRPARPVSVLAVHGTSDPIVPYGGGEMRGRGGRSTIVSAPALAARWRNLDRCPDPVETSLPDPRDGTSVTRSEAAPCAEGTAVELYTVTGGGHTWPSGKQYLPVVLIGRTTTAVDADEVTWQFFAAHHR
jgi:polyhydroxybutyrate depolymerase